jgi:hypothetical protein
VLFAYAVSTRSFSVQCISCAPVPGDFALASLFLQPRGFHESLELLKGESQQGALHLVPYRYRSG